MDGILNINKSAGKTSYGVVAAVKRLTGERHAGHAGTLDPDATGVLPVCLGKGTRVVEFLADSTKAYRAVIEAGAATDTYDASGQVTRRGDASGVDVMQLEEALSPFRGDIRQVPPMYSALKHQGQKLYELARAGIDIERESRPVTIYRLELLDWQPPLVTLEIECSKGTYVRSIAHDLGERLGCGAHLKELTRTRCGIFDIKDAITLTQLETGVQTGDWQQYLHPIDSVLQDMPSFTVDEVDEAAIKTGSPVRLKTGKGETGQGYGRAYSADGRFLAILTHEVGDEYWRPKKVFI
ncbi:MAG: tRNA pseudouridine(55) synthase TruB [Dehalococcoidales bacterium]|jgi:tRNA pseudouridine55 synthase